MSGEPSAIQRIMTEVRGGAVQSVEPPAAYASVPRLQLDGDSTVGPWERRPRVIPDNDGSHWRPGSVVLGQHVGPPAKDGDGARALLSR